MTESDIDYSDPEFRRSIPVYLEQQRRKLNLTKDQLADGVSPRTLSRYLNPDYLLECQNLDKGVLRRLLENLRSNMEQLLEFHLDRIDKTQKNDDHEATTHGAFSPNITIQGGNFGKAIFGNASVVINEGRSEEPGFQTSDGKPS